MIWFVLFIIIAILIVIHYHRKRKKNRYYSFGYNLFAALCFAVMIGLLFALLADSFVPRQWVKVEEIELVSLRDSEDTSGQFFLGTGSFETEKHYFFYKKVGEGYQPGKLKASDKITIFERSTDRGEIRKYTKKPIESPWPWPWYWIAFSPSYGERYEIIIPEGSLRQSFILE